jgi:hypothetical protein
MAKAPVTKVETVEETKVETVEETKVETVEEITEAPAVNLEGVKAGTEVTLSNGTVITHY